ncbi:MAG: polysaccharide biosynthesis/export family protein [Paludibacteraceae bacterium]|nr:polysaccharide biosynthesis/export family protein [Paludibacteraceae bacterium]
MKQRHVFLLVALVCLLGSCVTTRKVNYLQEPGRIIPAYKDTVTYADYRLQKGDRLYVQVYSLDEKITSLFNAGMTNMRQYARGNGNAYASDLYTYLVEDDGAIRFPTLGRVQVLDLTVREVKHLLESQLAGMVVQTGDMPNISVEVQVVQRSFSIIGLNAGRYALSKEKVTIYEALAMAGDINDFGDRSRIKIIREIGDSTVVKSFDVRSKDIINSEFYYVEPNDVIYIRKFPGYSFGINSASAVVSITATTISFGVFIYTLVDRFIIRPINKSQSSSSQKGGAQ